MKPYIIITCLAISLGFGASAQDHKADIKRTASLYVASFFKHDYPTLFQCMYPGRIAYYGGRDSLAKKMEAEDKQNAAQNIQLKNILLGEPGQVVKYGTLLYSVVPDTVIFRFANEADFGASSSVIAISADDGKSWTLATIENMKWLISILPDVAKLDIPKPMQLGILDSKNKPRPTEPGNGQKLTLIGRRALALVVVTHKKEYLADTTSMKAIKEQWIRSRSIGAFTANPADTVKYGQDAINGVNRYYIDDKKYPKVYDEVVKMMKYIGAAEPEAAAPDH